MELIQERPGNKNNFYPPGGLMLFEWSMFGLLAVFFTTVAGVKFYLVAFEFMELAKANRFWQITVMAICFLILTVVSLLAF